MSTDERLARIEEKQSAMAAQVAEIHAAVGPKMAEQDARVTKLEASTAAELKILKYAIGGLLVVAGGGGSTLLAQLLGGAG